MPQVLPATMTVPIDPALFSRLPSDSVANSNGLEEHHDSNWEYEYDECETEVRHLPPRSAELPV